MSRPTIGCSTRFSRAAASCPTIPLQAFLISLKLLAETMADLPNGHPGCLMQASAIRSGCSIAKCANSPHNRCELERALPQDPRRHRIGLPAARAGRSR
jgi:hypothetical protein